MARVAFGMHGLACPLDAGFFSEHAGRQGRTAIAEAVSTPREVAVAELVGRLNDPRPLSPKPAGSTVRPRGDRSCVRLYGAKTSTSYAVPTFTVERDSSFVRGRPFSFVP